MTCMLSVEQILAMDNLYITAVLKKNEDVFYLQNPYIICSYLSVQLAITCSRLTTETLKQGVKYVLS